MKALQNYSNFRSFLSDAFDSARRTQPGLSIDRYAKKLGFNPSSFKMILSGKRNLTAGSTLQIARALRLSPRETEFFEALVLENQSKASWQKAYYSRKLKESKKQLRVMPIRISSRTFLGEKVIPSLMIYLSDCTKTGTALSDVCLEKFGRAFGLRTEKVLALVKRLEEEGMIKVGVDGVVHFVFDNPSSTLAQKTYLKRTISEAAEKVDSDYEKNESYFSAFTFSTSNENLVALQSDLKELMDKHMSYVDASQPDARMAQACFQIFPISGRLI